MNESSLVETSEIDLPALTASRPDDLTSACVEYILLSVGVTVLAFVVLLLCLRTCCCCDRLRNWLFGLSVVRKRAPRPIAPESHSDEEAGRSLVRPNSNTRAHIALSPTGRSIRVPSVRLVQQQSPPPASQIQHVGHFG